MEIDAQKMEALKRVYADIILNTAKEAAARIMISERKALRIKQDLSSSKEEALFMTVRLKQMMDSKITEAEIKDLNQRKKIEELEAQLNEAEQIIIDLRYKLNVVQPLNEQRHVSSHEHSAHGHELIDSDPKYLTTDNTKIDPLLQKIPNKCDNKHHVSSNDSQLKNNWHDKMELPSIVMGSKMPEQCRNGCTQRIHAYDTNLSEGKLPPARELNSQVSPMKNEFVTRDDEKDEEKNTLPCPRHSESDKPMQPNSRICKNPLVEILHRRKRKIRFGKPKKNSGIDRPDNNHKPTRSVNLAKNIRNDEFLKHDNKVDKNQSANIIPRGGYKKRKVKYRSTLATSFRSPPCELDENDPPVLPCCETISKSVNGEAIINMTGNRDMKMLDTGNDQVAPEESEANNGISSQVDNERPIKYTFHRKRKKMCLSTNPDETTSLEKNSSKRRTVEKHTGVLEPLKSCLIDDEPSRDNRRLVQVARQLISLSGKKWR